MQDKLQELTDRLYNEGLSKGKHDGEELVQKAQAEADRIIAYAKAEAEHIIAQANKEAEEMKTKVTADVKMAATQSIAVTKQEIEKMVVTKAAAEGVKANMRTDYIFLGSKITADGYYSHEIKRHLLLGRKTIINLDSILKSRDIILSKRSKVWFFQ